MFDVIAISTYLAVSVMFWYTGLLPDLAVVRDKSTGIRKKIFTVLSLGWTGAQRQWIHHSRAYLFFAALATPLVISVHSVVSWDFALGVVPGWHTTIFAPYFVAGAIHSGLAMVITLMIPLRKIFHYERFITMAVLENIAKTIILTGPHRGICIRDGNFHGMVQRQSRGDGNFSLADYRNLPLGILDHGDLQYGDTAVVLF